jgi:hypothetical protein
MSLTLIGETIRLWKTHYIRNGYVDQFNVAHEAHIIDSEVDVRIVESKIVKGMWAGNDHLGYRAEDDAGKSYYCNWNSFPDDSMTPMWHWWCDKELWEDAEIDAKYTGAPYLYKDGTQGRLE